jgi:hypothetical protein
MFLRQRSVLSLQPLPLRISLETTLSLVRDFLEDRWTRTRTLVVAAALFDAIGVHFRLFAQAKRARKIPPPGSIRKPLDLECMDAEGNTVLGVQVVHRALTLADVESTVFSMRHYGIRDACILAPAVRTEEWKRIEDRIVTSFEGGENICLLDLVDMATTVLALGGAPMRITFLNKIGERLYKRKSRAVDRESWTELVATLY